MKKIQRVTSFILLINTSKNKKTNSQKKGLKLDIHDPCCNCQLSE